MSDCCYSEVVSIQRPACVPPPILNTANFNNCATWHADEIDTYSGPTTVGSNGSYSYYGTFDQSGNVEEWNDLDGFSITKKGYRGGSWQDGTDNALPNSHTYNLSSSQRNSVFPYFSVYEFDYLLGFRLASPANILALDNFVTVGDAGNSSDSATGYGAVDYVYQIGKYTVTNCEYVDFLNAIARTDTYNVYSLNMTTDGRNGIIRNGSVGDYTYVVKPNMGNKPVIFVDWFDAARYCNWLHNGKPFGDQDGNTTENGAYTLDGQMRPSFIISGAEIEAVVKNIDAKYYIPTENEWYKAAYYSPTKDGGSPGYYAYATQSDTALTCVTANEMGDGSARTSEYLCSSSQPTPTSTPVVPTSTPTSTPVVPTSTPTSTPVDPTPTPTSTPVDPTPTSTPVDPTPTPVVPTPTPVVPTPTPTIDIPYPQLFNSFSRSNATAVSSDYNWGMLRGVISDNIPNWGQP